jgi:TolB protein
MIWCAAMTGCSSFPFPFISSTQLFSRVSERAVPGLSGVQRFAAWSPDATTLALMSNAAGNWDVWTIGIDGSRPRQLTHEPSNEYTATWSPNGKQLVFSSDRLHRVWPNLWMLNPQQPGAAEQLSPGDGKYFFPTWSPDGTQIAFIFLPTGPPSFELRTMSVPGREIRVLSTDGILFSPPAWSPDGRRIAFASNRTGGTSKLWLLTLSTGEMRQLTHTSSSDRQPSWSPNGRFLAFTSNRSGNADIWVMDISTVGVTHATSDPSLQQLTHHPAADQYPQWSPDGKRIAFISTRSGHEAVWLMDLIPVTGGVDFAQGG